MAKSGLRRQTYAVRPNQSGVGRLEFVDGSADGTFHIDILVVLTAKGKVRGRGITIWQRHIADDEATRIVLDDSADAARRPEVPCTS